ncbi:hypothetical protein MUN88_21545 [Gracilibacillus caseinilyticus]|uniref:Uncharacterized protein n=1 Tax=Gracilibacillus caseinilyticus TaxID=2932256 RepID=A0ABY4EVZ1_9BACI|nr:hypothetical protein [Gracilibacillus caseinilyticus]UOQ48578.1 hypothetical protein MUN88_21545 [Gracilibacillus caseinilyticus]
MDDLLSGLPDSFILLLLFGYLALGIMVTIQLRKTMKTKRLNKKIAYVNFFYHAVNFYLIYDVMTVPPQVSSGNGNPHIPHVFISMYFFLYFCYVVVHHLADILLHKNNRFILLCMCIACLFGGVSVIFQLQFVSNVKVNLGYPMGNWWYWWTDIHLNYLYFNQYIFLFGICASVFIATLLVLMRRHKMLA